MNKLVCNFAPVRFLPHRGIGEFVNVGVVAHFPELGTFGYRLISGKKDERVANFFPELNPEILKLAMTGLERELERVRACDQTKRTGSSTIDTTLPTSQSDRFRDLVRRREGILHFGEPGTLLTDGPDEALEELFGRFVERRFSNPAKEPMHLSAA